MLLAKNLSKSYGNLSVLKNIHLQIQYSEIVSIVGASGAGKSTLLQILGTLDTPDSGELFLNELSIHSKKEHELAQLRNEYMGFIFQFHNLLPELTAYENIDVAEVMKIRQPFAGSARVKFDELAQGFGDELYKTQFDAPQAALTH